MIRVAIVDDHPVVRDGTAALLGAEADIEVVASAGDAEAAIPLLTDTSLDVILLDVRLESASGLQLIPRERVPAKPAILVFTAYDYPKYAEAAFRMGAAGFVLKSAPLAEVLAAVRAAAAGRLVFGLRPAAQVRLTPRETAIVSLVVEGRTNDEVGAALGISARTVETHLRRIFERANLGSRTELASRALREGWLEAPN